ncbi:MAG: flagellar brake protein [Bacillota bacterium]|uniref:Flagellar brake domain-containing protein n=1 Tax=Virgibacillus salarius TaxID=447199 RepID=A0A941DUE2_9BACI|nr:MULTISPECIES: flagellar brake domain-containing protein [Bacillaceae]NAZ08250.1 flagellar brake protein [Agaribacter marinus]MBR7795537.1 flagellar brake domain-containing protein [Virgibacillus salarius]MCC2249037.1 flagellar brake domain-containing protein [Virgibacillus sp. AGTR]MDY7043396.1 flagellar brake domain-containing protein [Virgibacillus sp. M23]QRZ17000.1 flagellar brake domain-containing protein [Virgibacillus sp. AGTR]
MKIGTVLNIEIAIAGNTEKEKYRCKVIEKNENYLFIDYPVHMKTQKSTLFVKGTLLSVTYSDEEDIIYHFNSEIIARVKLNVPAMAIALPDENMKRIQRRTFVRVNTAIDVAVHMIDSNSQPFTTITSDLSAGGISIIIPKHIKIVGCQAEVWLTLPFSNGTYYYVRSIVEFISFQQEKKHGIKIAALKFLTLSTSEQQNIIRYCFEKQREARKKEMSLE